jgi:hypothetical protein
MKTLAIVLLTCALMSAKTLTVSGDGQFGYAVAVSGNYMVVTGWEQSEAYLYQQTTTGWVGVADLIAEDKFVSAAISGNTIVLGGLKAAYVFTTGTQNLTPIATLIPSDGFEGDQFGYSVGINGNTIVVGAPKGGSIGQGKVYLYVGWANSTETAQLSPSDGYQGELFGYSVAVSGVQVAVGAPYGGSNLNTIFGDVYMFQEFVGGWSSMTETAQLKDGSGNVGGTLGLAVAMHGTTVVAGEPGMSTARAVVFTRSGKTWASTSVPNAILTTTTESDPAGFGDSVTINGTTILVGDPDASNPNWHRQGAAFAFTIPQSGWVSSSQNVKVTPAGNYTGGSVALGRTGKLIVGAPSTMVAGKQNQGAVFIVAP